MTQLYPWPSRFLNIGRKKYESYSEVKKNIKFKKNSTKTNKVSRRSSSRMMRTINQKINLVNSDIFISKKFQKTTPSSDMFTPIMKSFNSVSHRIVSRYFKPKVIDLGRYPKNNRKLDTHIKCDQLRKKDMNRYVNPGIRQNLKMARILAPTNYSLKNPDNGSRESRRPSSAPTKIRHNIKFGNMNSKNPRVNRRASSEIKSLECSEKLYDMNLELSNIAIAQKLRRSPQKTIRKHINSEICVEGLPDIFLLKCDSKKLQDINPQLFGSLTSTTSCYPPGLIGKPMNILPNKEKREKRGNITEGRNTRVKKIPDDNQRKPENHQTMTRLRRSNRNSTVSNLLKSSSSYRKNRNLFCETNVILEENPELETIGGIQDANSTDLAKQKIQEMKQTSPEPLILKRKRSKHPKRTNPVPSNSDVIVSQSMEENSISERKLLSPHTSENVKAGRQKQIKITHYVNNESEHINKPTKASKKKKRKDSPDELLLQLYDRTDLSHETHCEESHNSLRRSFFTVSRNNSSVYDTCKTHLSGDVEDLSNGRQPPPPTPNNDVIGSRSAVSSINIEEKTPSFHEEEGNVLPGVVDVGSNNSSISESLATDIPGDSPPTSTLAKISGIMSTEGRSDVLKTSILSSNGVECNDMKVGEGFEHLCEINELKFAVGKQNILCLTHKMQKIPSISDTYMHDYFPYTGSIAEKNIKNLRLKKKNLHQSTDGRHATLDGAEFSSGRKQSRLSKCSWKDVQTLPRPGNSELYNSGRSKRKRRNRSNNVSSTSKNDNSTSSNVENISGEGTNIPAKRQTTSLNSSQKLQKVRSWCSSEISNCPTEFIDGKKIEFESIVECNRGVICSSADDISLTEILKDSSELDRDNAHNGTVEERIRNHSSLKSLKKETDGLKSENMVKKIDKSDLIGITDPEMCSPKTELRNMKPTQLCPSTVFLKSPSESYCISRESFPDSLDEAICDDGENENNTPSSSGICQLG